MELKKNKKEKILKVNGRHPDPLWKKISCKCNHDSVETQYPLITCVHCKSEEADLSIPDKPWIITENTYDKNGQVNGSKQREVTEITLTNCQTYGSAIGWFF
tara:strand:+ start:298 stop:603 length:306 start_codon:yes stop_codon:yes gene_type:complete